MNQETIETIVTGLVWTSYILMGICTILWLLFTLKKAVTDFNSVKNVVIMFASVIVFFLFFYFTTPSDFATSLSAKTMEELGITTGIYKTSAAFVKAGIWGSAFTFILMIGGEIVKPFRK